MINRIRDGILYPRELLKYSKDKAFFVVLYILFFLILMSTSSVINVVKYDGLSTQLKLDISDNISELEGNCVLNDASLTCEEDGKYLLFNAISFDVFLVSGDDTDITDINETVVYVKGDSAYVQFQGVVFQEYKITDLPSDLHNLDFANLDAEKQMAVEALLFSGIDQLTTETKLFWGSAMIIAELILNGLMVFGFVLINTYFLRKRYKIIPFKDCFAMSTYSATSVFILLIFFNLIEVGFFVFLILIILAFRQNGEMIDEINRRLKKPLDKE